jgi:hypothetical protein
LLDVGVHCCGGRQNVRSRWFGKAEELSEKAPLRQKLVNQDGSDRIRLLVRLEVEQVIRHGPPHAHRLVRFAGVGDDEVLENRLDRSRHFGVGDSGEFLVHCFVSFVR